MSKRDTCATQSKAVTITDPAKITNPVEIFKIVQAGTPLEQGDILYLCPYLYPIKIDMDDSKKEEEKKHKIWTQRWNIIILGHSCDLDNDKIDLVLVCPAWELNNFYQSCAERFVIDDSYLSKLKGNNDGFKGQIKNIIGNAIAGKESRYTVLKGANLPEIKTEPWLVDFGNTYTLPIGFLDNFSRTDENNKHRLRLDTEYRVDLIAKFNYFLLRAFLPKESRVEYANIKTDFDEDAVDKILRGEDI